MPSGREIVKALLFFVHDHYNLNVVDFQDDLTNDFKTTDEIIQEFDLSPLLSNNVKSFLQNFQSASLGVSFLDDPFPFPVNAEIIDFSTVDFRKRNRAFYYSDMEFGYLSTKKFINTNPLTEISNDHEGYRCLIDFIGYSLQLGNTQKLIDFMAILDGSDTNKGLLVHKIANTYPKINIYSYLYYRKLLLGGKIELEQTLSYSLAHGRTTVYNTAIVYNQYFEVYDIINELNHAEDIITRFLKLYHIIEYLVYRVELVKIEAKARGNRTFVREISAIAGKVSPEKEFDLFKKNFTAIYSTEITSGTFVVGPLTPDEQTFFTNYLDLPGFNYREPSHICKLIYKLRNSIVHNKESEFHLTMTNTDDYRTIIPIISNLILLLERKVLDKISGDYQLISYQGHQSIPLY